MAQFFLFSCNNHIDENNANDNENPKDEWNLVWEDEFDGSSLDESKWVYDNCGSSSLSNMCGNAEEQVYTERKENIYVEDGILIIRALRENYYDAHFGHTFNYTSGKVTTQGKASFKYGKIVVNAKIPFGMGLWTAIWMLGDNIGSVGWPLCGEIDIMEHVNLENRFLGTVHSESQHGSNGVGGEIAVQGLNENFHDYSLEWDSDQMSFAFNDSIFFTLNKADYTDDEEHWPFDQPFFLILNLAVGGNWPGSPNSSTEFPSKFFINYVRVYEKVSS